MGVKGLLKHLKSKGLCEKMISVGQFKGKRMTVDVYNLFHVNMYHGHQKVITQVSDVMMDPPDGARDAYEPTSYLINTRARMSETVKSIVETFIIPVLKAGVYPLFVFDGDQRELKDKEVSKRVNQKTNTFTKFFDERDEILALTNPVARAMRITKLHDKLKYCYKVSRVDLDEFKDVLREFGFEPLTAKHDGEDLCCMLVHCGQASLVYSRDSDCLLFGVPTMVTSVHTIRWGKLKCYQLSDALRCMGDVTQADFSIHGAMLVEAVFKKTKNGINCSGIKLTMDGRTMVIVGGDTYGMNVVQGEGVVVIEGVTDKDDVNHDLNVIGLASTTDVSRPGYATTHKVLIHGTLNFGGENTLVINTTANVCVDHIVTGVSMSMASFRDYCILIGTDFNTRIPGIGPVKAGRYIKKYGSVIQMFQSEPNHAYHHLNYNEVIKIFYPKDYRECLKEGKVCSDLIPSNKQKLVNKYRLSAEKGMIEQAYGMMDREDTDCAPFVGDGAGNDVGSVIATTVDTDDASNSDTTLLSLDALMRKMTTTV